MLNFFSTYLLYIIVSIISVIHSLTMQQVVAYSHQQNEYNSYRLLLFSLFRSAARLHNVEKKIMDIEIEI